MIVCVQGLWHLGSVTAACLAAAGHEVIGLDFDADTVAALERGRPPVAEPGLDVLLAEHAPRLSFSCDAAVAVRADVLWVTYDTPVDGDDRADVEFVVDQVARVLPHVRSGTVVIVSSQLPVGTCARLAGMRPEVRVACVPENLRLGNAIATFRQPDRVVVGVREADAAATIAAVLAPITTRIEWMGVESAEMTKHAINAFLAVSVTFANEIAVVCERIGADAKEVERGLKTEARIGPRAYLAPGGAFAGGTLARDVAFLTALGTQNALALPLLGAVRPSNEWHKSWARRRLEHRLGRIAGTAIAVWGLTYKPGTDTLRRSAAVELCGELVARGATVAVWDPVIHALPDTLAGRVALAPSAEAAARGARALVVATEWPEFRRLDLGRVMAGMERKLVLDANRFLADRVAGLGVEYDAVGVAT